MQIDRRAGTDRRAATRYRVTLDIEWEGPSGRRQGTLSDISTLGCFVLCSGDVEDGVAVKLFLSPADGINVELGGVVSNHLLEVGFAARFLNPSTAQQEFLRNYVEVHATD